MTAGVQALCVAEIGGTTVKIGFACEGKVTDYARTFPTDRLRCSRPVVELARIIREACQEAGFAAQRVVATVPGFLGRDQDTILNTANIPELNGVRLASELSAELATVVTLERDTVLQLLGEHAAGAVQGEEEVLAVYIGTGIGAAYLGASGIFRGGGWALEIGHVPAYRPDLQPRPDRVEMFASGRALAEMADARGLSVSGLFSVDAASEIKDSLDMVIWQQASAIAAAAAICSPRILLLGGGVVDVSGFPRDLLAKRVVECLPIIETVQPLDIRWAQLGWKAAIFGALHLS